MVGSKLFLGCVLLTLLACTSCSENSCENFEMREVIRLADGYEVLILRTSSGFVLDSIWSKNGIKDGIRMHRNQTDSSLFYYTYNQGRVLGPCSAYDSRRRLIYEGNYRDSIQIGEWSYYHENGVVSSYEYFNDEGRVYLRSYDTSGVILKNMGEGLLSYKLLDPDSADLGSGYVAEIMCAKPPNSEVILFYGDTTSSDRFEIEIENNRAIFSKVFDEVGEHVLTFVWGCDDTISRDISRTIIYRTIRVVE
jgi:antitoxin component YwqK of YwqJK toxin-antitoxin module